ncbi:MAG: T9SS type A sorting domain-containing protein [Chitinophagaceae bacterium]|nr:T9SS type A sorting domain-containing protein [Chitinophagaceae bacterium]
MKYLLLPLFLIFADQLAAQELLGFVGGWKMDSNCQLIDISDESSADGVLVDVTSGPNREDVPNAALSFNQSTSYITLGVIEKFKLPNDKTISFWIKPVATGSNHTGSIFCYGTGIVIRYQEQGSNLRLVVMFGGTTYITRNLTANQWQNITITFQKDFSASRSKVFYYVNFALAQEADQPKTTQNFDNSIVLIGPQDQDNLTNGFRGSLDDFKIYNRTLTSAEVQNLALPVTLEYFRAKKLRGPIELSWKTQLESNVSHFELQKSTDGNNFSNIENIAAGKYTYTAYDVFGGTGMAWYRLKVVDVDGKISFSNVVRISTKEDETMRFFPNPVKGKLQLMGSSGYGTITIINNSGMIVKQKRSPANNIIDVSDLAPGLYYITFFDGNKRMSSKFTKL